MQWKHISSVYYNIIPICPSLQLRIEAATNEFCMYPLINTVVWQLSTNTRHILSYCITHILILVTGTVILARANIYLDN